MGQLHRMAKGIAVSLPALRHMSMHDHWWDGLQTVWSEPVHGMVDMTINAAGFQQIADRHVAILLVDAQHMTHSGTVLMLHHLPLWFPLVISPVIAPNARLHTWVVIQSQPA
jgi:hypothetical protein